MAEASIGRVARYIIEGLELLLGLALALLIFLSIVKVIMLILHIEWEPETSKEAILSALDLILLLILSIDILRTLFTAIARHALPIRIVIEAAILAILRELIAVEVRHLDYKMVIALSFAFFLLVLAWIALGVLQKRGELESSTEVFA